MAYTLVGFAEMLVKATMLMPLAEREAMEKAAALLEVEAKSIVGQPGILTPNAAATVQRKGMNTPGLDTGATQESITHNSDRHEAYIGSNEKKLIWLEKGSHKTGAAWGSDNPPRPILGLAVVRKGDEAAQIVGHAVEMAIAMAS